MADRNGLRAGQGAVRWGLWGVRKEAVGGRRFPGAQGSQSW